MSEVRVEKSEIEDYERPLLKWVAETLEEAVGHMGFSHAHDGRTAATVEFAREPGSGSVAVVTDFVMGYVHIASAFAGAGPEGSPESLIIQALTLDSSIGRKAVARALARMAAQEKAERRQAERDAEQAAQEGEAERDAEQAAQEGA